MEGLFFFGGPGFLISQTYISPDGKIENPGLFYVATSLGFSWFALLSWLGAGNRELACREVWVNWGVILILACIGCYFITGPVVPEWNRELYREDGFFENMTFVFFAVSSLGFWASSGKLGPADHLYASWVLRLVALGSLFIAMEEISWGQRVFSWETPAVWEEVNYQGETNIHNLGSLMGVKAVVKIVFVMVVSTVIGFSFQLTKFINRFGLGVLVPGKEMWCFAFVLPLTYVVAELFEEILSIVVLVYSIGLARRLTLTVHE